VDNPRNDVEDESKMLLLRGKSISRLSLVVRRAVQWVILLRFSYFPVTVHTLFGRALSLSVFCVAPFFFSATVPGGKPLAASCRNWELFSVAAAVDIFQVFFGSDSYMYICPRCLHCEREDFAMILTSLRTWTDTARFARFLQRQRR